MEIQYRSRVNDEVGLEEVMPGRSNAWLLFTVDKPRAKLSHGRIAAGKKGAAS